LVNLQRVDDALLGVLDDGADGVWALLGVFEEALLELAASLDEVCELLLDG
jgi:hypothetical protein